MANSILEGLDCVVHMREWIQPSSTTNGHWNEYDVHGVFLEFSTDYEEFENGVGQFPVAIIVTENGIISVVPASQVEILSFTSETDIEIESEVEIDDGESN